MTDTHIRDTAIYQVRETRVDCDGSCWSPGAGEHPTNLEWTGLPPEVVKLVERAFREGQPPRVEPVLDPRTVSLLLGLLVIIAGSLLFLAVSVLVTMVR